MPVFQNAAFGGSGPQPRDMLWALPYSIFIFAYDEIRKLLMRKTGGQQREGCRAGTAPAHRAPKVPNRGD